VPSVGGSGTLLFVATRTSRDDAGGLEAALRERRGLLERSSETYLALADRLDDEIAALEAARRLGQPAEDVDFEGLLDEAERKATQG
jgi:hypothetical protein